MGRPPAGPGGMKVEDLPRVTIRLEPEVLERARVHARDTGQPLWRLVQELLRSHLDQIARPSADEPVSLPVSVASTRKPAAPKATAASDQLRQLPLGRDDLKALESALHWRTSLKPLAARDEHQALADLFERVCAHNEQLFRIGLDRARRRPRGPTTNPPWELSLDDCRRLRRTVREFLAAGKERTEEEIRAYLYRKGAMPEHDQERHSKRIRKELRSANGKLRAVLKKIPWH